MLPKPLFCALCPPLFLAFPLQKTPDPQTRHAAVPADPQTLLTPKSHRPTDPSDPQTPQTHRPTDPDAQTPRPLRRDGGMRGALKFAGPQGHERVRSREPRILASLLSSRRLVGGHGFRKVRESSQNLSETLDFGGNPSKTHAPTVGRGAGESIFGTLPPGNAHSYEDLPLFGLLGPRI